MTWLSFWLAVVVAIGYTVVPGALALRACGISRWNAVVFAPVTSAALVGVLSVVYAAVGLPFRPVTLGVGVVTVVGALLVGRFRWRTTQDSDHARGAWCALAVGVIVSMIVWAVEWAGHLQAPNSVGKGFDIPWHLSIVRHMVASGDASTLDAGHVVPTLGSGFYPASWHALAALVTQSSPASLATAVNATILVVMAIAWPLSLVALAGVLFGRTPRVVLVTSVLSAAFVAFPFWFVAHGGLYANQYGEALLPALLAAVIGTVRGTFRRWHAYVLVGVAFVGCAIAQPNTVFTALVVLTPFCLARLYRRAANRGRFVGVAVIAMALVTTTVAWVMLERLPLMRRTVSVDWLPSVSGGRAAWQAVSQEYLSVEPTWWTAALVLVGALVALRRARSLLAAHVLVSALYVVDAGRVFAAHNSWLRTYATGYWYHDSERLAAAAVVTSIPLAVLGVVAIAELAGRLTGPRGVRLAAALIAAGVLVGSLVSPTMKQRTALVALEGPMRPADATPSFTINADKVAFLTRVAAIVGHDGVANDPMDGSAYAYGLAGVDVYFKAYPGNWMGLQSPDMTVIRKRLRFAATDPAVCPVVVRNNLRFVVDLPRTASFFFTETASVDGPRRYFSGLEIPRRMPGFTLVLDEPRMRLFRIDACWPAPVTLRG